MSAHANAHIRRRHKRSGGEVQQQMAAMIDIVFLLLVFFVLAVKTEDLLAALPSNAPAPQESTTITTDPELLTIGIFPENYRVKGRNVSLESMDEYLGKIATYSTDRSIIVKCAPMSDHARLIRVLNLCHKNGFKKVSLFKY